MPRYMTTLISYHLYTDNNSAELLQGEDSSFCCRDGRIAVELLPSGWTEMFMDNNFRYKVMCNVMMLLWLFFYSGKPAGNTICLHSR